MSNGQTLIQEGSRAFDRQRTQLQGIRGPFEGLISEVISRDDALGVTYGPTSNRRMPINHPFVGSSSWIRSVPEIGTRVLMQNRSDTGQAEIFKALPIGPFQRASDYFGQKNTYREMNPGEHDIAASGFNSAYLSRRGNIDLISGPGVSRRQDRDRLEIRDLAPTHRQQYLNWLPGQMGDELRIGIVKRWSDPTEEFYVRKGEDFRAESFFELRNPTQSGPTTLIRRTEGHVHDDAGVQLKQFSTRNDLRVQNLLFTDTDEFHRYEMDVNGNTLEVHPSLATTGKEVQIPAGNYRAQIGIDRDVTIGRDEKVTVQENIRYTVGNSVLYDVTENFNITSGANSFAMNNTSGSEAVGLVTAAGSNLMGFQAQATNDGGLVSIFGPSNSGIYLTGQGNVLINDGQGGGVSSAGTVTAFSAGGSAASVGDDQINLILKSGKDALSISPNLVQLLSGDAFSLTGKALSANVGNVFLGANAAIPAVMGLALLGWLDGHFHIATAEGAPTTPPTVPASSFIGTPQSLLSLSVYLSPNI